jgi:hypothetical protein
MAPYTLRFLCVGGDFLQIPFYGSNATGPVHQAQRRLQSLEHSRENPLPIL